MVKRKKKSKKQKKLTPKQLRDLQDKMDLIEHQEESSNVSTGAGIGVILFILWIVFKFIAKSQS